eukprot:SAG31_NODE_8013_length_1541_cov_1.139390_1_plen_123_part_00
MLSSRSLLGSDEVKEAEKKRKQKREKTKKKLRSLAHAVSAADSFRSFINTRNNVPETFEPKVEPRSAEEVAEPMEHGTRKRISMPAAALAHFPGWDGSADAAVLPVRSHQSPEKLVLEQKPT